MHRDDRSSRSRAAMRPCRADFFTHSQDYMKFQLPWSLKPPTAPLKELREQLANAQASYEAAQAATQTAQVAFDDAGDDGAQKALDTAEIAEKKAKAHVGRAERLVEAAENQRKAEERAALEREAQALEEELSAKNAEDEQLVRAEVAGYLAAAEARAARHDRSAALIGRAHRLQAIRGELGLDSRALLAHQLDAEPPHHVVAERLFEKAGAFGSHEPIARYLNALGRVQFSA